MQHRAAAQIRASGQVNLHGAVPACQPFVVWPTNGVHFKDACIVDEDVDATIQAFKRLCPKPRGNRRIIQVTILTGQGNHLRCGWVKACGDCGANSARGAGDKDMCFHRRCLSQRR